MEQSLPPDVQRLIEQLKSPDSGEKIRIIRSLADLDCQDERVRLGLEEAGWHDPDVFVRSEALSSLGRLGVSIRPPDGWVPTELAGKILLEAQAPDIAPEENAGQAPTGTNVEKLNLRQQILIFRYGMSPNTFELMLKYLVAALILGFLLTMWCEQKSPILFLIGLGLLLSAFIFTIFFPFLARVRCGRKDCNEMMQRVWVKESIFQYRVTYRCNRCGYIYDPGFTFRFGGPSDF